MGFALQCSRIEMTHTVQGWLARQNYTMFCVPGQNSVIKKDFAMKEIICTLIYHKICKMA
jgi:hypothetical protein